MLDSDSTNPELEHLAQVFTLNLSDGIFDLSNEAFFLLNDEGKEILDCNRSAIKLFQAESKSDLINLPFERLYKLRPLNYSEGIISEQIANKGEVKQELSFITLKGHVFWGSMIKRVMRSKAQKVVLVKISRATDYLKTNEALSNLLKSISKYTGDAFFQNLTKALCQVFNTSHSFIAELNQENLAELEIIKIYGFETNQKIVISVAESCVLNVLRGYPTIYPFKLQELFPEDDLIKNLGVNSFLGSPIFDSSEVVIGLIGIFNKERMEEIPNSRNILSLLAARSGAEIQRRNSNLLLKQQTNDLVKANQIKDKLLNLISNDLKAPLKTALDFTSKVNQKSESYSKAELQEKLKVLHQAYQNLYLLTENISDWSNLEQNSISFNPALIHLCSITSKVIDSLEHLCEVKNVTVVNNISDKLYAFSDYNMTSAIIRNLLSNAIKFSEQGSEVFCTARETDSASIISINQITSINTFSEIKHSYMNAEKQLNSMDNHNEHPLLGLYLSKKYAERQSGRLWLSKNKKNSGITFFIELPNKN